MKYRKYVFVVALIAIFEQIKAQSCVVDSFSVKENFELKRYGGKWYAVGKKNPEGLFLQDNISAEYVVEDGGTMTASSKGRVKLFGFWLICADMAAQYSVPDPLVPAKMYMTYQGLASYLSSGGDNYWVIDTDYDNYAITYACRTLNEDGTCNDGYSIIFSPQSTWIFTSYSKNCPSKTRRNLHGWTISACASIRSLLEENTLQNVLLMNWMRFTPSDPNII